MLAALADLSLTELLLIAGMAVVASIIGGVAGYGTGALMPLVLVPIVGAEPVVPIIAISALFTNTSRAFAFRHLIDWRRAGIIVAGGAHHHGARRLGLHPAHRARRHAGDRQHAGALRAAAPPLAPARAHADRRRARRRVGALGLRGRRHQRGRHHPALAADGGRPAGRRRDRDRRGDFGDRSASSRSRCSACSAR